MHGQTISPPKTFGNETGPSHSVDRSGRAYVRHNNNAMNRTNHHRLAGLVTFLICAFTANLYAAAFSHDNWSSVNPSIPGADGEVYAAVVDGSVNPDLSAPLPAAQGTAQSGTVVSWGVQALPYVESGTRFSAIAAGEWHSLALKLDGTVVAWGYNYYAQASVPAGLSGVIAVAAGGWHSLALRNDGTVVAWGRNGIGQANVPAGLSGVIAIAAGEFHSLALKDDGTVVAWGYNSDYFGNYSGQSTVPTGLGRVNK